MNNREKQAAFKARQREMGLTQVTEWVPVTARETFKGIATKLRNGEAVTSNHEVEALERELAEARALIEKQRREIAVLAEELAARPRAPDEPLPPNPDLEAEFQAWLKTEHPEPELSDRDRRIRDLYQQGTTKRAIGRELGISDGTVRKILGRLGND
ncbi:hypothetical protein ThidrDRAFT_2404 [Thiorhodococcus drewsii AZ1]|uniref:Uncharacterized protein n=1 Tax=Thiorhodococcus drewsii AZ1 TaxID=765913 RepID=G2E2H2_9GAMM|nr:hypothetical protein [Thiorhodococcus drewsii]EGV30772.1 hypothetical protein ThidrDRAFT_2404 [Thiorhodococcus drewsii AZ1]